MQLSAVVRVLAVVAGCGLAAAPAPRAAPSPVTGELAVVSPSDPAAPNDRRDPAVGMAADGRFAVAYVEEPLGEQTVFVQRFDASGNLVGARVPVTGGEGYVYSPELAMASDGRFVVAYVRRALDGLEQHVEFKRFDAEGVAQGGEVLPGALPSIDESTPEIGIADDGRIAVAWKNYEDVAGTATWRLRYRAYDAAGAARFDERDVSSEDLYDQAEPSLSMAPDGRFVITWERRFTFMTPRDVPARLFDGAGEPAGDVFNAFSGETGGSSGNSRPAAGIAPDGSFAIAWEGGTDAFDAGISMRLLTAGGAAAGDPFRGDDVDTFGTGPNVVLDDDGTLFLAYECNGGCEPEEQTYLREFAAGGTPRGGGVAVGHAVSDSETYPEVATDGQGRLAVAWNREAVDAPIDARVRLYNRTPRSVVAEPTPTPTPTPTPAPVAATAAPIPALACEADRLVLTDVYPLAGRTRLLGAAPSGTAGQTVQLVSSWDGKAVASATVQPDLTFTASAPLPPARLRSTNKARYVARLAGRKSRALKFARRMYTTDLKVTGARITFAGSVVLPLARPAERVTIVAAGSCSGIARGATVARVKPSRTGRFSATFALPRALATAPVVFLRAQTRVRQSRRSGRTFPTFTLIRSVRGG